MVDGIALGEQMPVPLAGGAADAVRDAGISVTLTHRLDDVAETWSALAASGIQSPGQSLEFTRLWTRQFGIAEADQFYLVASRKGRPLALLPLHRRRVRGVRTLSWFPGAHVGCNAPLVDAAALAAMSPAERRALWTALLRHVEGADMVYLKAVPQTLVDGVDLFAELGQSIAVDTLYRAQFSSWDEANVTQRSKSRRKHDRQQGERLEALGAVSFETLGNGDAALAALDLMFRQRAARFRAMGVFDPFAPPAVRAFYDATARAGSGVEIKLHLLRLDGVITAVRFNIVAGNRLFCLISSMSDDPTIQTGSPGKQCLLRVMQTEFDAGFSMFDMGAGFTDEKRHWCNVQIPVRQHYQPITRRGALAAQAHRNWAVLRQRVKSDARLLKLAKAARGLLVRASANPLSAQED